jgi:hypothetical protein
MRFTSYLSALGVLTLQLASLSKPVDPKKFKNFSFKSEKDCKSNTNFNSFVFFVLNTITFRAKSIPNLTMSAAMIVGNQKKTYEIRYHKRT